MMRRRWVIRGDVRSLRILWLGDAKVDLECRLFYRILNDLIRAADEVVMARKEEGRRVYSEVK